MNKLNEEEVERIRAFAPLKVKRRKLILEFIVEELNRRNFRSLDEANRDDLQ